LPTAPALIRACKRTGEQPLLTDKRKLEDMTMKLQAKLDAFKAAFSVTPKPDNADAAVGIGPMLSNGE
jgi:hypothetical protein